MEDIEIKETTYVKDLGFGKWVMVAGDKSEIVTYGKKESAGLHSTFEDAMNVAKKAKAFSGNQIGLYQYRTHWNEQNELVGSLVQVGVIQNSLGGATPPLDVAVHCQNGKRHIKETPF